VSWDDDTPTRSVDTSVSRIPILPVLLIAFGAAALFHQMFGRGISVFPLAIGLFLIARSRSNGSYICLVIGAVMTGSGAGNLVGDLANSGASDALGSFGTAAGFFWLANVDRGRSNWAIIPAAIIGLIGIGELGLHVNELANGGAGSWLLPAGVVVAGILLLGAHRMPGPLRLAGLVFVGAAALSLVTNQSPDPGRRGPRSRVITTAPAANQALPPLTDRTVSVDSANGPVIVEEGEGFVTGARIQDTDDDQVDLVPRTSNSPITLKVPAGTKLELHTTNGPITVRMPVSDLVASSENGVINVEVAGDTTIEATTRNGVINVDGRSEDGAYAHSGADPGHIELHTQNGAIVLVHAKVGAGLR
jgi:hypothetical protein